MNLLAIPSSRISDFVYCLIIKFFDIHMCMVGILLLIGELWSDLRRLCNDMQEPWILSGDFNMFLSLTNHNGSARPSLSTLVDFNHIVDYSAWHIVNHVGSRYTWHGGTVWDVSGVDWIGFFFCNESYYDLFPEVHLAHLSRTTSNHCPLLIQCGTSSSSGHAKFEFLMLRPLILTFLLLCVLLGNHIL